jgi:hypothetical protein
MHGWTNKPIDQQHSQIKWVQFHHLPAEELDDGEFLTGGMFLLVVTEELTGEKEPADEEEDVRQVVGEDGYTGEVGTVYLLIEGEVVVGSPI